MDNTCCQSLDLGKESGKTKWRNNKAEQTEGRREIKSVPTIQVIWGNSLSLWCMCFFLFAVSVSKVLEREDKSISESCLTEGTLLFCHTCLFADWRETRLESFFLHCHGVRKRRKQDCALFLLHTQMTQKTWSKGIWYIQEQWALIPLHFTETIVTTCTSRLRIAVVCL